MVLRPLLTLLFSHTLCVRLFPSERWHHSVNDKSSLTMCWQCFNGSTHLIDAMATFYSLLNASAVATAAVVGVIFCSHYLICRIHIGYMVDFPGQQVMSAKTILKSNQNAYNHRRNVACLWSSSVCVCFLWCVWCYSATFTTESMRTSNVTHIKCEKNQLYTNQFFHSWSLPS